MSEPQFVYTMNALGSDETPEQREERVRRRREAYAAFCLKHGFPIIVDQEPEPPTSSGSES